MLHILNALLKLKNTAGKCHTTRQHEQKSRIQVDTLGAAAMHDLYVIQGPNVTRDACEKIAFFAFHAFVVEDSRFQQNQVRTKLYNCGACVCKSNVEIRIAGSFCRLQILNSRVRSKNTASGFRFRKINSLLRLVGFKTTNLFYNATVN